MSQTGCLDSLIQQVDSATHPARAGQRRIVVDVNRHSVVNADWFRSAASLKYFLVSSTETATCQTSVICVNNTDRGRAIALKIEFEARCPEGREESVATALCDDPNPSAVLTRKVKEWVHELVGRQPAEFLDGFPAASGELESQLKAKALIETGLDLSVEISLYGAEQVSNTHYGPTEILVRLRDYGEQRRLRLQLELTTIPGHLVDAVAYRGDGTNVEDLIEQGAQQYFVENVPLSDFYGQPKTLAAGLKDHLNESLKVVGRMVQSLDLECDERLPAEPYETQEQVEYRVFGQPEPIIVRSVVQLTIQDYATYLIAGAPSLAAWLPANLNEVVQQTLTGKSYEDILLELEPLARDIRNRMSFKAAAIGCGMQQQLTVTSPSVDALLKEFEIVASAPFDTSLAGFQISLKTVVVAMLRQPDTLKQYLARGVNLAKLLERRVLDEVGQTLLQIHPEQVYARQASARTAAAEPLKTLLARKIREVLASEYNVEVLSVAVEISDLEFRKWLNELRRETTSFEVEVASHHASSRGPFVFYVDCRIDDISGKGWEMLGAASFNIEKIKDQLMNTLKSGLETHEDVDLAYLDGEAAGRVRDEIAKLVKEYALREFGLSVSVRNVRRKPTEIEKRKREAALANELIRIDMLRKLEHHLLQLIGNGGREEEIAQCRQRISNLQSYKSAELSLAPEEDWPAGTPENLNTDGISARSENGEGMKDPVQQTAHLLEQMT